MGIWVHRLSALDEITRTAVCSNCGPVSIKRKRDGWRCRIAERSRDKHSDGYVRKKYRLLRNETCARCGWKADHECQLDVHHVDRNHRNNSPENLQTLCANCHRLVTWASRNHAELIR